MPTSKHEQGQGLIEYALILSLVGIVVIAILTLLGPAVSDLYNTVVCELHNLKPGDPGAADPDCSTSVAGGGPPPAGPTDSDGDGIPDSSDACPTEPGPAPGGCPAPTVRIVSAVYQPATGTVEVTWTQTNATGFRIEIHNTFGLQSSADPPCSASMCTANVPWVSGKRVTIAATGPGGTASAMRWATGW